MTLHRRHLLPIIVALAVGAAAPAPARAQGDTVAVAINTRDGTDLFKFAFNIRRVMQDTVDQSNAAVAYASCEACRTVAISLQIVLVMGDPETVTPENLALAINQDCVYCDTAAFAYQFVLGGDGLMRFTSDALTQLQDLRRRIAALKDSGLTDAEIQVELDKAADEIREILRTGIQPVGPTDETEEERPAETPTPTATPEEEATPAPTQEPESTPTAEPTAEPTPEPTP